MWPSSGPGKKHTLCSVSPTFCSDCRTTMIIYALVPHKSGRTSRSSDTAPVCVRMSYLYTRCVWGVVKAIAWNSIVLCMAHMSGVLLLCSFTLRHGWGDRISMCGSSEVHWCSVCNLQDTFLGLLVTLFQFRAVWWIDRCSHLTRKAPMC